MEQKIKFVEHISMNYKLLFCFLFLILVLGSVSAGFGSTYIPNINGKNTLQIPIGSNSDYFIYPQNSGDKILLVKINILNGSDLISNTLQETYEIPVNTSSDEFPIKITFKLNNDTELIGKEFYFAYELLSTYKGNETDGLVTFSPIGYKKSFYVKGIEPVIVPQPIVNTTTPINNQGGGGGGSSSHTPVKNITNNTIPKPQPNPVPNITKTEPTIVQNSIIPTTTPTGSNIWIYLSVIGGICVLVFIIFLIKSFVHKSDGNYLNYANQEINNQEEQEII